MKLTCQKCGKPFEAPREKKFCSKECRSQSRANLYFYDDHGQLQIIPAPPEGWVLGFKGFLGIEGLDYGFEIAIDQQGNTTIVEVSRSGKRKRMKTLPPNYTE